MRKVILASMFLAVALVAFGQHGKSQIGGKTASKSKAKPKATPTPPPAKPFVTMCGVYYKDVGEFLHETTTDEWRVIGIDVSGARLSYYNPQKEVCEAGILKSWIKSVETKTQSNILMRYEFRCQSGQYRVVAATEYSKDGDLLNSALFKDADWKDAIPDSLTEMALKAVCRKP